MSAVTNVDAFANRLGQILGDWQRIHGPHLRTQFDDYQRADAEQRPLEHHARVYIVDPLLEALGWQIRPNNSATPVNMITEFGADGLASASNRQYFDYLGSERSTDRPLLLVETKSFAELLPGGAGKTRDVQRRDILRVLNQPANRPPTKAWREHSEQVRDYLERIVARRGVPPPLRAHDQWSVVPHLAM